MSRRRCFVLYTRQWSLVLRKPLNQAIVSNICRFYWKSDQHTRTKYKGLRNVSQLSDKLIAGVRALL